MAIEFDLLAGKKLRTDLAIKAAVKLDTPEAAAAPTGGGTKIGLDSKVITSIAGHACTTSMPFLQDADNRRICLFYCSIVAKLKCWQGKIAQVRDIESTHAYYQESGRDHKVFF